jgi:hypothetical protein
VSYINSSSCSDITWSTSCLHHKEIHNLMLISTQFFVMLALVLLYNYYHLENYPHDLEFLNCLNFCRFVVVSCAKLISYMRHEES